MRRRILKYIAIVGLLFVSLIVWMIFIQPLISHKRNLKDLAGHVEFFKSIKHPEKTSELYYKAFFGNSTGTSNHCEHIILQIRKYNLENEEEIKNFYKNKCPEVSVSFIRTLNDCCGDEEYGYKLICFGNFTQDQPNLTFKTSKDFLPVYIVEYLVNGSHLSDWKCN
jgi:hypothetical protein